MKPVPMMSAHDLQQPSVCGRQLVDQKADADHLAAPEGVREAEKRHRRHAPGREIVAGREC